jgi:multiple sugar transport system permease protein
MAKTNTPASGIRLKNRTREAIAGYLFIAPWLIGFFVFHLGAMIASMAISFVRTDMLTGFQWVGLANYAQMPGDDLFWKALTVTLYYTFGSVPTATVVALIIALILNQNMILQGFYRTTYYLPSIVSGVAVAILWAWIFNPNFGLLNYGLGLVGIQGPRWLYSEQWAVPAFIITGLWGAGGSMLLYLAGFQGIPTHLYEAARIDGATSWHTFWNITLPMTSPVIFFNVVMGIIGSFQVFTMSFIMTNGGPNNATLTFVLFLYRKAFQQMNFGYASALAWMLFVIILAFTLLVFRSSAAWVYYEGEVKR